MIELSIEELLLSIVGVSLFLIGLLAFMGYAKESRGGDFVTKRVVRCCLCGGAYTGGGSLPKCRSCQRANRRGSSKRLG